MTEPRRSDIPPAPSAGDFDYAASLLRDLRRAFTGLGSDREDSEAASIDRVVAFLEILADPAELVENIRTRAEAE